MASTLSLGRPRGPAQNAAAERTDGSDKGYDDKERTVRGLESGSETATDIQIEEDEDEDEDSDENGNGVDSASTMEIERRYLTFETPLPTANTVTTAKAGTASSSSSSSPPSPPPPAPDLSRFSDPHLWPEGTKNVLLALSCIATCLTAYSAGSFSPPAQRMANIFGKPLIDILAAGITVFCIGFGLAPMLLAPLSETNGRYPVFVVSGIVTVVFHIVCGTAPDYAAILIARLLVGAGNSVFSTMVGGVIADMWHAAGRNTPMALFSGFVMVGTGLGPLVSATITFRTTYPRNRHDSPYDDSLSAPWRWVFWHQAISNAVLVVFLTLLFKESRGSVLLSRRAAALNRWYDNLEAAGYYGVWLPADETTGPTGSVPVDDEKKTASSAVTPSHAAPATRLRRIRWLVKDDEDRTTILHMVAVSVYRPFHMLFTEPVVFFFSLWVSFSWAVLYLQFGSIFLVFEDVYGWNMEKSGHAFVALIIGAVLATVLGVFQDRIVDRLMPASLRTRFPSDVPESRLYAACFTSVLLPAGLFTFGFSARPGVHWIWPMIGIAMATFGIYAIYLATFNYLADVYHRFASSALAAQSFCRNMLGGVFPLIMRPLFLNLGVARAGGLLGGIAIGLTLVPWVLTLFGEKIRRRSKFAMALNGF